jgi:hypothetical protein
MQKDNIFRQKCPFQIFYANGVCDMNCVLWVLILLTDFSSMLIKWICKPNQDWTKPSVLSTLVHHSAEPCMGRRVQLSSTRRRAHVWANWGNSGTSLPACSQLENHFLVDTHKNFSCFLLCQDKQAENLTKSLVVTPEKIAGLQSA